MPRPLVIGNGRLLITFDGNLVMRDLYFPHVGLLNHIEGRRNVLGVWADNRFSWLHEDGWERRLNYLPDTLITDCTATHQAMGISLTMNDLVHYRWNIYLKKVTVRNLTSRQREAVVFFTNDFCLDETDVGDTTLYDPSIDAVYHYKRKRCFLIGGTCPSGGMYQYATGRKRFAGAEGTWRDAEDGHLEGHPISQGSVDSTISFRLRLPPDGESWIYYWIVVAGDFNEAREGHFRIQDRTPEGILGETESYWRAWIDNGKWDLSGVPSDVVSAFKRSLLIVRTQADQGGAIIAANDSDILEYNRDHYSYMWPRDGALVAYALDRAGYPAVTSRFFRFCERAISEGGFLWHKYNPDGTVGSSWHPWINRGKIQLPIQEDETALVVWALGNYYRCDRDLEFIESLYEPLIRRAADFMISYRDERTKLPLESYDLWEERRGVFTFTAASVSAGLRAAGEIATLLGDARNASRYLRASEQTLEAMVKYLYSEKLGRFLRGVYPQEDGKLKEDATLESSTSAVFLLGLLPADDPRVVSTMKAIARGLWAKTGIGGVARYHGDYYFRKWDDPEKVPGNPWIICTLWLAQWYIVLATEPEQLQAPMELIRWAISRALPGGVLPEQVHPFTGAPLSVAPLTWSHSTLIWTILDYAEKRRQITARCIPVEVTI